MSFKSLLENIRTHAEFETKAHYLFLFFFQFAFQNASWPLKSKRVMCCNVVPYFILLFIFLIWLRTSLTCRICCEGHVFGYIQIYLDHKLSRSENYKGRKGEWFSSGASQRIWSIALESWQLTTAMFKLRYFLVILFVPILLSYHATALVESQDKFADISFGGTV